MLGAPTPAALTGCDVLIEGSLRAFCADRGIDTARLARRTTTAAAGAAGTTMNPAAHTATTAGAGAETGAGAAETTGSTR
jgi:isopentenyl-diphosphate delta-isomerase